MKIYSKEGLCMVDVKRVKCIGNDIAMTCKLMGAYSMTIYLRPEELREALKLVDWELVSNLPAMLVSGTKGEDKFNQIGANLASIASKNTDILIGPAGRERIAKVMKEMGAASAGELFDSVMLIAQIILANKEAG